MPALDAGVRRCAGYAGSVTALPGSPVVARSPDSSTGSSRPAASQHPAATALSGRSGTSVAILTLGCARNEVDSSELAAELEAGGFRIVDAGEQRPAITVVNTCAFVAAAKKDSIDQLLAVADTGSKVVAVGCLAERYGDELAAALPEADAVLGFDAYPQLAELLDRVVAGDRPPAHRPVDRRRLLPIAPASRPAAAAHGVIVPGHAGPGRTAPGRTQPGRTAPAGIGGGPPIARKLLRSGPVAPLKIASGCDRRCTFCAIPSFRGSFVSRPAAEIMAEAEWLADQGIREIVLVSENTTSYGKDLGGGGHLERLLARLAAVPGLIRIRASYLQPAETRQSLVDAIADTPKVAAYFDMSFQHAAPAVLRRMRRFGSTDSFLELISQIRAAAPAAGIRSNVIVGFPGETAADVDELRRFLTEARLDAIGVFGYSDEDGTAAERLPGKLAQGEIDERVEMIADLADELTAQRAEDRIGTDLLVLVDEVDEDGSVIGRAAHQAPEVDGSVTMTGASGTRPGDLVAARVTGSDGIDLLADASAAAAPAFRVRQPALAGRSPSVPVPGGLR